MSWRSSASASSQRSIWLGTGIVERMVDRIAVFDGVDAAVDCLISEHVVDRLQDRRSGTERGGERDRIEFQFGVLELAVQGSPPGIELAGCRPLERKDRLFLVTDREHRAQGAVARALAGGEFEMICVDDVPLPRAGVLRLVDQHVIDAAVELVAHPFGGAAGQQGEGPVDQIVKVERAARGFFTPVVCRNESRDRRAAPGAVARRSARGEIRSAQGARPTASTRSSERWDCSGQSSG